MDEHEKKKGLKTKYPTIPKELKELMADEFWSERVQDLIELIDDEINLLHSESSFDLIFEELAFYRAAYKLQILQIKSKARASGKKRLIAIQKRNEHAEALFQAAVEKINEMDEKVTYKTLVRELDKMQSPIDGHVVYSFDNTDKKPSVVSTAFLKSRLSKFNSSRN
jgi:hypothetical protein